MEPVLEHVLQALDPQDGDFFENLRHEARRKIKGGDEGNTADPVHEAMVLDLAGSVLANRLDTEDDDAAVEQLQFLLAVIHKEKDRALGRMRSISRGQYSD